MSKPSLLDNPWLTGMTLRDVFAAMIVGGKITKGEWGSGEPTAEQATIVWQQADTMVAARDTA